MATQLKQNSKYSEAEWEARQKLAACYRIFAHFGWDELIYNHLTLKVPEEDDAFLINPYGMHFSEITASTLVKVDIDGNKLDEDNPWHINKAGFVQHSLFHRQLPDIHAIAHTHTTATHAVCSLEDGLIPSNFYSAICAPRLAYHDFQGITTREEEGPDFLRSLGDKHMMMLRNHGPVVMGRTLEEMFQNYWVLQRACEIQVATMSMGKPIVISDEVLATHAEHLKDAQIDPSHIGAPEFQAMVRIIDREDRSWRE